MSDDEFGDFETAVVTQAVNSADDPHGYPKSELTNTVAQEGVIETGPLPAVDALGTADEEFGDFSEAAAATGALF